MKRKLEMNEVTQTTALDMSALMPTAPVEVFKPEKQNGVTMPHPNSRTGLVWYFADMVYNYRKDNGAAHAVPIVSEVSKLYEAAIPDASNSTCRMHFGEWLKFYDRKADWQARIEAEKPDEDAEKAAKRAEQEAKAAAKLAARIEKLTTSLNEAVSKRDARIEAEAKADADRIAKRIERDAAETKRIASMQEKLAAAGVDTGSEDELETEAEENEDENEDENENENEDEATGVSDTDVPAFLKATA